MLDFTYIDTEEKAYLLGLFGADGNVRKNRPEVGIEISGEDGLFLYTLRDIFGVENKIHNRKPGIMIDPRSGKEYVRKERFSLRITNTALYNNFLRHGVVPAKTWILKPPADLPNNLIRHYIRGYFDGDGSVSFGKYPKIYICGASEPVITFINEEFKKEHPHSVKLLRLPTDNVFRLVYNYRKAFYFLEYIYQDATIFLPRKRRKAEEIFNYYKIKFGTRWTKKEIEKLCSLYPKMKTKELLNYFPNRTISSLEHQGERLNLSKVYNKI